MEHGLEAVITGVVLAVVVAATEKVDPYIALGGTPVNVIVGCALFMVSITIAVAVV